MSEQCGELRGTMQATGALAGSMSGKKILAGAVAIPQVTNALLYDGPYEVKPKVEQSIILSTKDKRMKSDVVVDPVEVVRVSNPTGGTTVYIGGITNV